MFSKHVLKRVLLKKLIDLKTTKCQTRSAFYNQFRSGDKKYEEIRDAKYDSLSEWDKLTIGLKIMKDEFRLLGQEIRDNYSLDSTYDSFENKEIVKLWDFNQRNNEIISSYNNNRDQTNDMLKWRTACDSDYDEGYSQCDWTVSPTGRALFTGHLDTKLPLDGRIIRSGYAFIGCEKHRKAFYRQNHFNWTSFTHLLVKCRGDGRNWFIILNVSDDRTDITWFDRFQFVLYTHGGPYWQWCKIPFSRFYLQAKGYAQEVQPLIPLDQVSQIGFLLADKNTGPFNLEIDYIGAMRDDDWTEETCYETYYHKENPYKDPGNV